MKKFTPPLLLIFISLIFHSATIAQKIYSANSKYDADVKVFVADYKSRADLSVFKVDYENYSGYIKGKKRYYAYDVRLADTIVI